MDAAAELDAAACISWVSFLSAVFDLMRLMQAQHFAANQPAHQSIHPHTLHGPRVSLPSLTCVRSPGDANSCCFFYDLLGANTPSQHLGYAVAE